MINVLDECQASNGCCQQFLSEIFILQTKVGANIFATSRFIPEIINKFSIYRLLKIHASDEDVQRYLEGHMFRLPRFVVQSPKLQEEVKTNIVQTLSKAIGRR
jgi:hypothetical protein